MLINDKIMDVWSCQGCRSIDNSRKCNKYSYETESMFIAGEESNSIISYVDFSRICYVIKCFPYFKQAFGKEYITFILSSISRVI